jgi:AcrR family transcriptional regulator
VVAHLLLEEHGEGGLNLRDIAARLETGVASLYYHFTNKDALLAELAVDGFGALQDAIAGALREPKHRTPFHSCCEAYVHFIRDRPALYALMYSDRLLAGCPRVRSAEADAFATFRQSMQTFGVAADKTENVALTLWALGRGIGALTLTAGADHAAARAMGRNILDGLSTLMGEPVKHRGAGKVGAGFGANVESNDQRLARAG